MPIDEYRDHIFPDAIPDHMGCRCGKYESRDHVLDHCHLFARIHADKGWYADTVAAFLKRNKLAFAFRREGDDALMDASKVDAEMDIALQKLTGLSFKYDTPLDNQWDALDG